MSRFEEILRDIGTYNTDRKQTIYELIKNSIEIHPLEREMKVRAELILEAIHRSPDLTKRGIRGLIAELVFVSDIATNINGWLPQEILGNHSFDVHLRQGNRDARIQVKTQRRISLQPMIDRDGNFIVEVQRTRGGKRDGEETRPYRFSEFDILAVCMQASTGAWNTFMYCVTKDLIQDRKNQSFIAKMQPLPAFPGRDGEKWSSDLTAILGRFVRD